MRESIGALSIFSIVMTFIILFTAYLAVSVNYANAFRVKNNLITAIENNEGVDDNNTDIFANVLRAQNYDTFGTCPVPNTNEYNRVIGSGDVWRDPILVGENDGDALACIYRNNTVVPTSTAVCRVTYYKVLVFFKMDLPVLGDLLTFNIKGDTRGVYDRTQMDCVRPRTSE